MSQHQKDHTYAYLTITGEGDAQQLIKNHNLKGFEGWNKGEIAEGKYQFDQMCIKLNLDEVDFFNTEWLTQIDYNSRKLCQLPAQLSKTVHIVTHSENMQGAGFHLSRESIRTLAKNQLAFHLHGYRDADDGHDFPGAVTIKRSEAPAQLFQRAYFSVGSRIHSAQYMLDILKLDILKLEADKFWSIGDYWRTLANQEIQYRHFSRISITSGLPEQASLPQHISALLDKLETRMDNIWQLARDFNIDMGIASTGHMSNPHHLLVSADTIQRIAGLGLSLDMNLYFG